MTTSKAPATLFGAAVGDEYRVLSTTYRVVALHPEGDNIAVVMPEHEGYGESRWDARDVEAGRLARKVYCGLCSVQIGECVKSA